MFNKNVETILKLKGENVFPLLFYKASRNEFIKD